jgi:FkbM family methyltransferase
MLVKKDVPGYSLKFDVREATGYDVTVSDQIVINEMFDENVYDIHDDTFETNDVMIDIGANIGAASILAWTKGARTILAYEPEKHNHKHLLKNIKLNKLQDVIFPVKQAVSNVEGTTEIFDGQGASFITGGKGVSQQLFDSIPSKKEKVPTTTLNDILKDLDEVALLKIDCEGGEYMIMETVDLDQLRKCQRIVMEYHRTDEMTFGRMLAKLSLVFNTRVFGHYDSDGGQIDGHRY